MITQITPSLVSVTGAFFSGIGGTPTIVPFQRKTFTALGRTWVFYSNGQRICYRTSTDNINWSSETTVTPQTTSLNGNCFSLWFDGIYIHYVYLNATTSVQYRRGTPVSNGTITWGTVRTIESISGRNPTICVDSNGYPIVTYLNKTTGRLWLNKSSVKNGNWTTASGFPKEITSTAEVSLHPISDLGRFYPLDYWQAGVVPLTNGKLYVTFCFEISRIYGKLFDGTNLLTEEMPITELTPEDGNWSITSYNDTVYLAAHTSSGTNIATRTNSWSSMVNLGSASPGQSTPSVSVDSYGNPIVFWINGTLMMYAYYNGIWNPVTWFTAQFTSGWNVTSHQREMDGKISVLYSAPTTYPYNVYHAGLSLASCVSQVNATTWKATLPTGHEAEIGDIDSPDFQPHLKFKKWGGECIIGLRFPGISSLSPTVSGEKITAGNPDYNFEWKPVPMEQGFNEEGGFDWKIIYNIKPSTNHIDFAYNAVNVEALHQIPMNQEHPSGWSNWFNCDVISTETEVRRVSDNVLLASRPIHTVNAIVFLRNKPPIYTNQTDADKYRFGIVGTLFRMQCTDSSAVPKTAWADWSVSGNTIVLTIDQTFLNTATYPVIIAPIGDTFGYTSITGAASATYSTPDLMGQIGTPASSGTVDSVSAYVESAQGNMKGIVVLDSALTILTNGVTPAYEISSSGAAWRTAPYSTKPSVTAATAYDACYILDNAATYYYVTGGSGNQRLADASNNYTTPTDPTDGTRSTTRFCIYATYTPAAGGTKITTTCNLTAGTSIGRFVKRKRYVTSNLSLNPVIVRFAKRKRYLTANLTVSPTVARARGFFLAITTNLSIAPTLTRLVKRKRYITANLSLSPVAVRKAGYRRAVTSNLSIASTVSAIWAGVGNYVVTIVANLSVGVSVSRKVAWRIISTSTLKLGTSIAATFSGLVLPITKLLTRIFVWDWDTKQKIQKKPTQEERW